MLFAQILKEYMFGEVQKLVVDNFIICIMEDFSKYNGEGTMLRKAQLRMLDILVEIDRICRKHNIPYWIEYGTLLGAVRHGGFIPWDDDLDIAMMKEDYDRFLSIAPQELPDKFVVQNLDTEKYFPLSFTKIVDKHSVSYDNTMPFPHSKRKYKGLWVDIFPLIKGNVRFRRWLDPLYGKCFRRVHHFEPFCLNVFLAYLLYPVMWLLKQLIVLLCGFCNDNMRMDEFDLNFRSSARQKFKSDYLPTKDIRFENIIVSAPNNWDKVLTVTYGDYMQIPPEEKRITHLFNEISFSI